jgi:hypothetical protein
MNQTYFETQEEKQLHDDLLSTQSSRKREALGGDHQ